MPLQRSYGELSTAFYDLDKPAAPPDAVAYYLSRALRSNGPVLEPMCGSGRFLLPLRVTDETAWLRESGCSLHACKAPARIEDDVAAPPKHDRR